MTAIAPRPTTTGVIDGRRLVFVCGLHRSGTTPLSRVLTSHPDIAGMTGTGKPRDEGQHVQSVYPAANQLGGSGSFALQPRAHMTERDVAPDTAQRLSASWSPYWDLDRRLLLEKSPPNIVRTRFLQRAFPGAAFVVIVRHPVVVAQATAKWSRRGPAHLLRNWIAAHQTLVRDAAHVQRLFLLSYEDLTADPEHALDELLRWLGADPAAPLSGPQLQSTNDHYMAGWTAARHRPVRGTRLARVERRLGPVVRTLGYDLQGARPRMLTWQELLPTAVVHASGTPVR